ncbi:MAG: lysylphosphatidylglycerol synthase transmembrane domain-containing protein [Candidatus Micrarchaeia archaeon]
MGRVFIAELILSVFAIAAILHFAGFWNVVDELKRADVGWFFFAIFFYLLNNLALSYRIYLMLSSLGERIQYVKIVSCHFAGMLASDFTPARSGYFATAVALSFNKGVASEKAVISILGPQVFDFALKVVVGTVAVAYLLSNKVEGNAASFLGIGIGVIAIFLMCATILLLLYSKRFLMFLRIWEKLPLVGFMLKKMLNLVERMQKNAGVLKKLFWQLLGILIITWLFKALEWFSLAMCLGITVDENPLVFFALLQPLISLLQFVPAPTLAGMGLSEAGATAVLMVFGVPAGRAVAFALLARGEMMLVNAIGGIFEIIGILKKGKSISELAFGNAQRS